MKERGSPGALLFVGVGFWIVAYRLMPEPDWHPLSKAFVGFLSAVGAAAAIGAIKDSARRSGPWWEGAAGRTIAVASLWLVIAMAALACGTPHLLYQYLQGTSRPVCVYLGWKGLVRAPASSTTAGNHCRPVEWL